MPPPLRTLKLTPLLVDVCILKVSKYKTEMEMCRQLTAEALGSMGAMCNTASQKQSFSSLSHQVCSHAPSHRYTNAPPRARAIGILMAPPWTGGLSM